MRPPGEEHQKGPLTPLGLSLASNQKADVDSGEKEQEAESTQMEALKGWMKQSTDHMPGSLEDGHTVVRFQRDEDPLS